MQLVHVSNLMHSLSHIYTYQKENWESRCSHFNQSWGALSRYRRHLLLALTPLAIHPLYKEFIWCNYVVPSMRKNNAFYWGKMVPYLLLSLTMFSQDSELKLWCDFLFVVEGFFLYIYSSPIECVCAVFFDRPESWADLLKILLKMPKNVIQKHFYFLPCGFLGPFKAPWVLIPFVFVQCCAFDLCCAQLYSPLIIMCLSYLKKARRHVSEVSCILWSFYPGFYRWCFRKRRTKQKHYPWQYFIICKFYKLLLSLCHCVPAQSNHNPSHSWRFDISVVVVCWHCWWSGQQEVQSKLGSFFFFFFFFPPLVS